MKKESREIRIIKNHGQIDIEVAIAKEDMWDDAGTETGSMMERIKSQLKDIIPDHETRTRAQMVEYIACLELIAAEFRDEVADKQYRD